MTDVFDEFDAKVDARRAASERKGRRRKRSTRTAIVLFLAAFLVAGASALVIPQIKGLFGGTEDYPGPGSGEVIVTIQPGSSGQAMGDTLTDAGVVKSTRAFVDAYNDEPRANKIQAGTYSLKKEMSGAGAVAALLDPASRAELTITIPEGFTKKQVIERIANVLSVPVADVEKAAADSAAISLPAEANGDIEGWVAPLTYKFAPGTSAQDALKTMIEQRVADLESIDLPRDKWERTIIIASIVEREVNWPDHYGQVARVIENRLIDTTQVVGKLQMDSTVMYGVGKTSGQPTQADLADDNPYNTYVHKGLPVGPISNPSLDVIKASVNPPEGDWLYFVTINLDTGETLFSNNLEDHNTNVAKLRAWVEENQ